MKRTERDTKRTSHRKGKDVLRKAKFKEVKKNAFESEKVNREVGKTNLRLDYLLEEQRALREILTQINLMDMGELLKKITEHSLNLLKVDHVQIRLLDKDRFLRRVAVAGKGAERFQEGRRLGSGRSTWVMENRRALAIKDISQDKVFGPGHFLREIGVKGYLLLPLISREQKSIGVLGFSTLKEREFTQEEIALAEQFAAGAAIAIENASLYQEARRREEIQKLLKEVSQEVTSLDLDSLLKKLTEKVCGLLKVDVADVRVLEGNQWNVRGLSGIDPNAVPVTQTGRARGRSKWIIQHRKALMIPDITQGEDIATGETLKTLGIRGYLGVPIFSRAAEVVGVLRALTYQPREFTQEEVDLLQQLANGAAIALENTRLLDNLKATNLELERSSHEQQAVRQFLSNLLLLDLDELLQRFTEEAVSLFHAEIAWVRLFDKEGKIWSRAIAGNEAVIKLMPLRAVGELVGRGRWMLDNRRPLAIKDMAQDPARPYPEMYKAADLHGFLGAPMFSRDKRPLGVIFVITRSPREFSQREIGLIEQFAAGAAIAIENARLFEETRAKAKELETLLYITSHDLREPLGSIENFSRMVNERYAERLDEKGQDFLMRVVRGARRMSQLLDDILALSRAQRMELPTKEVEGETIVREALKPLERKINETGAKVQVGEDMPKLLVDRVWATQAVYNLIANALKFTRDGEAPEVEVVGYQGNGEVGIVVRDRGPGVLPEHAGRIFQLFQRAVGREVEGTGAGLAIVRQVAERHGGRVWVEPREGGGSEFIITFGRSNTSERG